VISLVEALAVAAVLGAITALDAAPFAQILLAQPLPAALLAGVVLGDPSAGLSIGIPLQLLWTAVLPLGGSLVPDTGPPTVAGVTVAALLSHAGAREWADPAGLLTGLALGPLGARLVDRARRVNHTLLLRAEKKIRAGDVAALDRAHAAALGVSALRGAVLAVGGGVAGALAGLVLARICPPVGARITYEATRWIAPAGLGVLAASALRRTRRAPLAFALGTLAVALAATFT
jgi:PTS system mannose-specific IIC component